MEPVEIEINPECLKDLLVGNTKFRSSMDFRLEDSDVAICRTELNETEAVKDASIRNLREMLRTKWKVDEMDFSEFMNLFNIVSDVFCSNPRSQITGVMDIFDLSDESVTHIAHYLHPRNVRLWTMIMQELYPWRIKRLLFYNMNPVFYALMSSLLLMVKKKIADRVVPLRSDLKELHKYISPNILSKEYGGNLEDSECKPYLKRCLLDNIRYLQYEHSFIGEKS